MATRSHPIGRPKRENVSVISANFRVGMGDKIDAGKSMVFPAEAMRSSIPTCITTPRLREAVVEVHGRSPLKFNYVNPADDPARSDRSEPQSKSLQRHKNTRRNRTSRFPSCPFVTFMVYTL